MATKNTKPKQTKAERELSEELRAYARETETEEGRIEIDDDAPVSISPNGTKCGYVQAWIWVELPDNEAT